MKNLASIPDLSQVPDHMAAGIPTRGPAIEYVDLKSQRRALEPGLSRAIEAVMRHGRFINGPEVQQLEERLAAYVGADHVVACGSGTDALQLIVESFGIGAGDCVFVPSLTFVATAEAIVLAGATPIFVDVCADTGNICPDSLVQALEFVRDHLDLTPRAVIAVDLFSLPADYNRLTRICRDHGIKLIADAAQSFGSETSAGRIGAVGDATATSFYPSKALGCYGDGGATFTNDGALAERLRSVANHGVGADGSSHVRIGMNSRLDTVQAAVLLQKLTIFDAEIVRRSEIAAAYTAAFDTHVEVPRIPDGTRVCWSYYAIRSQRRDGLMQHMSDLGIPSVAYYTRPIHRQPAFAGAPAVPGGLPNTDAFARSLLCLPMHPYLTQGMQDWIIEGVQTFHA